MPLMVELPTSERLAELGELYLNGQHALFRQIDETDLPAQAEAEPYSFLSLIRL